MDEFIRKVRVKKGRLLPDQSGCVHAIKGGTLILETQQSSDITYRVYDYDRLSDGKPRQLHVEQSIATIEAPFKEASCDTFTEKIPGLCIHTLLRVRSILWTSMRSTACLPENSADILPMSA